MPTTGSFYTPHPSIPRGSSSSSSSSSAKGGFGAGGKGSAGGLGRSWGASSGQGGPRPPSFPNPFPSVMPGWPAQPPTGAPGQALYTPTPMVSQVDRDPYLMQIFQANEAYRKQLAGNTDQDAINAMMRQRDVQSGIMNEQLENAAARGLDPSSGASQYLQMRGADVGRREAAGLNAALTSQGRAMQMGALGQSGGLAGAAAGNLLGQQGYALDQWRAQQQAAQAQAQLQLAAQNQAYGNMMSMAQLQMQALGTLGNIYSGF